MIDLNDSSSARPLCVDCDGTLLKTDLLHEAFVRLLRQRPLDLLRIPGWLLKGKAFLKARLAERVQLDIESMPKREEVVSLVEQARGQGRRTVLVTASPESWAHAVAKAAGSFSDVMASSETRNLSGSLKAEALVARFGEKGFDYLGDSHADLSVWPRAANALVVGSPNLAMQAESMGSDVTLLPVQYRGLQAYVKAMRIHQWLKNLLVLFPLAAAHQLDNLPSLADAGIAFLAFGLCASAVYLINDLLDLDADRAHPSKCKRPFASGLIPLWHGLLLVPILLSISSFLASILPMAFSLVLALYFVLTLAYSFWLKRQIMVDVSILAILYTLRIIAGAAATSIIPSFWLLAFSMFVFTSLAMIKRYSEMRLMLSRKSSGSAGRGYRVEDLPVLAAIGVSTGVGAVLVLALYIHDPETTDKYPNDMVLWMLPVLLLYWISRIWTKAHRDELDDDPVIFASTDWQSQIVSTLVMILLVVASWK
jgi:4-hydroxybenzoate polyprenyltransferase/phosphoserine phosphatase